MFRDIYFIMIIFNKDKILWKIHTYFYFLQVLYVVVFLLIQTLFLIFRASLLNFQN